MSGPILPSDLQVDVGMSADEVSSFNSTNKGGHKHTKGSESPPLKESNSNHPLIAAYSSTVDSDGRWNHGSSSSALHSSFGTTLPIENDNSSNHDNSPSEHQLGLFSEHSSPGQAGSFMASSNSTSGFDDLRTPCRFSDQSPPDHRERSEASLTSAIAAISYMANAGSSPFPSLDGLSSVPHELDSGEKTSAVEGRNKGSTMAHSRSHPVLLQPDKMPHSIETLDSTPNASNDLDFNTLLRILTPQGRKRPMDPTSHLQSDVDGLLEDSLLTQEHGSSHQHLCHSDDQSTCGLGDDQHTDEDITPCQLQIPLFGGRRAAHLLADLPQRLLGYSSEAALSLLVRSEQQEFASVDSFNHQTATSCTDLGRRSGEDMLEDEEGSDTVEPLDSFLQHTLGTTRRRFPVPQKHTQHFQSPSSGTFLNQSYYGGDDAQDALKRLLECFSSSQQQHDSSFLGTPAAAAAAAAAIKDKHLQSTTEDEGYRPNGTRERLRHIHSATDESLRSHSAETLKSVEHQPPHLYLSPLGGTSISSQESLSPCGRSSQTVGRGQAHQGSATAPAAMITDAEAMLANLLNSLGNSTGDDEDSNGGGPRLVRGDSKASVTSQHRDIEASHRGRGSCDDWAQPVEDDEIHDLNQMNSSSASSTEREPDRRWDISRDDNNRYSHLHPRPPQHHLFASPDDAALSRPSASDSRESAQRRIIGRDDATSNNWRLGLAGAPKRSLDVFSQRNNTPPDFDQQNSHQRQSHYMGHHLELEMLGGQYDRYQHNNNSMGRSSHHHHHHSGLRHHHGSMFGPDLSNQASMYDGKSSGGSSHQGGGYNNNRLLEEPHHHHHHFNSGDIASSSFSSSYMSNRDSREGYEYANRNRNMLTFHSIGGAGLPPTTTQHSHHLPHIRMTAASTLYHQSDGFGAQQQFHHPLSIGEMSGNPHSDLPDNNMMHHHSHQHSSNPYDQSNNPSNEMMMNGGGFNNMNGGFTFSDEGKATMKRVYSDDRDRMVYVSWIPKKARAYNTIDKRKMELDLKRKLREDLTLIGLTKVLLFPPKGVHCKLIFDSRPSAANFMSMYGGENRSDETERWKIDLCRIYNIDMHDKFDKTVVKIEWSQK